MIQEEKYYMSIARGAANQTLAEVKTVSQRIY